MNISKKQIIILVVVLIVVWYLFFKEKKETKEESSFKLPRWLKIGGCRACIGSNADGCCGGCVCKDAV